MSIDAIISVQNATQGDLTLLLWKSEIALSAVIFQLMLDGLLNDDGCRIIKILETVF
jgi:uncharacterized integral membrane protein